MKTFTEYLKEEHATSNLNEGPIWDFIKSAGAAVRDTAAGIGAGVGHVIGAPIGGFLSGLSHGQHGYNYGHYGSRGYGYGGYGSSKTGKYKKEIAGLKKQLKDKDRAGGTPPVTGETPKPKPPIDGGSKPTPKPGETPKPPIDGGPKPTPAPTPSPTPSPKPGLTKAEKKVKRELARPSGRLGKIETHPDDDSSFRAARTDPEREKLAARGAELEGRRAAIQTKRGTLRRGVTRRAVKNFNIGQAMTKAGQIAAARKAMGLNPNLTRRLAANRLRVASRRAGLVDTGTTAAEKDKAVMGAYESTELLNSVVKFLNDNN